MEVIVVEGKIVVSLNSTDWSVVVGFAKLSLIICTYMEDAVVIKGTEVSVS
jgi:hypothetical protein